jgi:hypothetical protein
MALQVEFIGDIPIPPFIGEVPCAAPHLPHEEILGIVRRFAVVVCENAIFTDLELRSHLERNSVHLEDIASTREGLSDAFEDMLSTVCDTEIERAEERGEPIPEHVRIIHQPSGVPFQGIYFPSKAKEARAKNDRCMDSRQGTEAASLDTQPTGSAVKPRVAGPEQIAGLIIKHLRASEKSLNLEQLSVALKKNGIVLKEPLQETYRTLTEVRILQAFTADSKNGRTHWLKLDDPQERINLAEIEGEPGGIRRMLALLYENRSSR